MSAPDGFKTPPPISISGLLKTIRPSSIPPPDNITANEIAFAISNIFTNQLTPVQIALLLYTLSITGLEQRPDVLAKCAEAMRAAAEPVDLESLREVVEGRGVRIGTYMGGLCDIVGTGGDHHSTFNVSTTSSILASSLLLIAKHGNRASTSKSGSADVISALPLHGIPPPNLPRVTPSVLTGIYAKTNYAFLFAPNFHQGMRHAAAVRKEMPNPTIFNLLGPLTNPVYSLVEARMIGVKKVDLVDVFAEALKLGGAKKALVICGVEDLDEISCAGPTKCAWLRTTNTTSPNPDTSTTNADNETVETTTIQSFTLHPSDFGLPIHPLNTVSPGLTPQENAAILHRLLSNELDPEDPILHFVLINTAALFVVAGVCDDDAERSEVVERSEHAERSEGVERSEDPDPKKKKAIQQKSEVITERGPGGGRWKEGVRLARLAVTSGRALEMVRRFAECTVEGV